MKSREKISFQITRHYIANEKQFNFPNFLNKLIDALGMSMTGVAKLANIKRHRLYLFCSDYWFRIPSEKEIEAIAEFFDIPCDLLSRKIDEYLAEPVHESKRKNSKASRKPNSAK